MDDDLPRVELTRMREERDSLRRTRDRLAGLVAALLNGWDPDDAPALLRDLGWSTCRNCARYFPARSLDVVLWTCGREDCVSVETRLIDVAEADEVRAVELTALRTRLAEATALLAENGNMSDDYTERSDTNNRTDAFLERAGYTRCAGPDGEWGCGRWLAPGAACPDCQEGTDG